MIETRIVMLKGHLWTPLGNGPVHVWCRTQAAYAFSDDEPKMEPGVGFPLPIERAVTLDFGPIWVSLVSESSEADLVIAAEIGP